MIHVTVEHSLDNIDQHQWDDLSRDASVYYDYAWFQTVAPLVEQPVYFCAWKNDLLVGVLPGFVVTDPDTHLYHNHRDALFCCNEVDLRSMLLQINENKLARPFRMLSSISSVGRFAWNRKLFPALIFMSPRGYVSEFLFMDGIIAKRILGKVNDYCKKRAIRGKAFLWLEEENTRVSNVLEHMGYVKGIGELEFIYPVQRGGFQSSLNRMISKRRNRIVKDMGVFRQHDIDIKYSDSKKLSEGEKSDIARTIAQHASQYDNYFRYDEMKCIIKQLIDNMASRMRYVIAKNDSELVGCCISLLKGERLYPKFVGYSSEYIRKAALHFNVTYYSNMEYAYQNGLKCISYGSGDPHAKMMRGCYPKMLNCYYCFDPGVPWNIFMEKYLKWINTVKVRAYEHVRSIRAWKDE